VPWLSELVGSGRVADLALAVMAAEAVLIGLYRWRTGRGLSGAELVSVLLPGACLVLALRSALVSADVVAIAAFLSGAMAAHVLDLRRRWR
jgi:hypothetical protein